MKNTTIIFIGIVLSLSVLSSCRSSAGAGGASNEVTVDAQGRSWTDYDLIPVGNRITYTIDISTPEGQQTLSKITLDQAKTLAETEAARKYNCDRLIDPRYDFLRRGKRILRITVDGRPGVYKTRENQYNSKIRQEIDINVRR